MTLQKYLASTILLTGAAGLHADFTYQEKTQITGGSVMGLMKLAGTFSKQARNAGAPVLATVFIKGNRMAHVNADRTDIVDLDRETITEIDHVKHQYTVMTFQEMKRQIDSAARKAAEEQKKSGKKEPETAKADLKFQIHVRKTGTTKQISGLGTTESILTMAMDATDKASGSSGSLAITNDMWLASDIPGYGEARDFYQHYAEKMGVALSGAINPSMLAMQPGAGQGMADMVKEMSKLQGVPVLQIVRMGITADGKPLPAASEAPLPASTAPSMPSAGDAAQQTATSVLASKLGGLAALGGSLGGFGRKKKADPTPAAPAATAAVTPSTSTSLSATVLMEASTEWKDFTRTPVDASRLEVPAGYSKVAPQETER